VVAAAGASLLAGGALGAGGRHLADRSGSGEGAVDGDDVHLNRTYSLRGEHQQGLLTPAQDYMFTAAFDVTASELDDLRELMSDWCVAAEQMTAGELIGGEPSISEQAPPRDTGEAWGYPPSSLTLTFGVGPTLFTDGDGRDRFGLAKKATTILREGMPVFGNETLQSQHSDGDLVVQACADDAQVAMHAIRNLTRIAFGTAVLRWSQIGYGRTSSTSTTQETPRNLFGFKDGTANIKAEEDAAELDAHVWVLPEDEGGDWLAGGSYMAVRKIRMALETWDRESLAQQQDVIGRDKRWGAALSVPAPTQVADEFVAADYDAKVEGAPAIPLDSHIRVVAPETNDGARMLRRGYNYTEGNDSLGKINAGLFFTNMTRQDALVEYVQHVASGLFAVLPGIGTGDTMIGQKLFG
jgi:deferrochelatase/peroxidase EfeB